MKRILKTLTLFVCFMVFAGAVYASETPSAAKKKWTFMVFLNADNNLDSFGEKDLKEMGIPGCGSNSWRNIVVLIDRAMGPATLNYVNAFGQIKKLADLGEVDMGDYNQLINFFVNTSEQFPAQHYALVIWNHGSGWQKNKGEFLKGISYDDTSENHITTPQLKYAMEQISQHLGRKLDVLCFDACLMQMLEVSYAVKDSVAYINAAEETEPANGYPYHLILGTWSKKDTRREFCENVVKKYNISYNVGGFKSSCHSTIDCSKLDTLVKALNKFCEHAKSGYYYSEFAKALEKVQKFAYPTNVDLLHFLELLKKQINNENFIETITQLETATLDAIVTNGTSGLGCRNAKGLAIYLPESFYPDPDYLDLSFARDTQWDEMIKYMQAKWLEEKLFNAVKEGNIESLEACLSDDIRNPELIKTMLTGLNFRLAHGIEINKATALKAEKLIINYKKLSFTKKD